MAGSVKTQSRGECPTRCALFNADEDVRRLADYAHRTAVMLHEHEEDETDRLHDHERRLQRMEAINELRQEHLRWAYRACFGGALIMFGVLLASLFL